MKKKKIELSKIVLGYGIVKSFQTPEGIKAEWDSDDELTFVSSFLIGACDLDGKRVKITLETIED